LGQFLFAALGSISREAELAPNLVGTPNDIREWMAFRMSKGRHGHANPSKLAHGWRADFVGRLFDDLLAGNLSISVGDAKSDHPLVFEPKSE
jgi:ribonuclease D